VTRAIQEELSKHVPGANQSSQKEEPVEERKSSRKVSEGSEEIEELQGKVRNLEIANRVKDQVIEKYEKDLEGFDKERQGYVSKLMAQSRQMGILETQLLQLDAPVVKKTLPQGSEAFGGIQKDGESVLGEDNEDPLDLTGLQHS
jgi:predicted RNase H-like nuclease (RuvC/YqgF family)